MFLAHVPAAYLITARIVRRPGARLVAVGLTAGVLPDLDLVRFYLLDQRRIPHHSYWSHEPASWAILALAWFAVARLLASRRAMVVGSIFFANVLAHLALDTVAGGIRWLAPFSDRRFVLVSVPAVHGWWVSNFLLHWTFLLELAIAGCAARELLPRARGLGPPHVDERSASGARRGQGTAA